MNTRHNGARIDLSDILNTIRAQKCVDTAVMEEYNKAIEKDCTKS